MPRSMGTLRFSPDKCLNVKNMAAESRATEIEISIIKFLLKTQRTETKCYFCLDTRCHDGEEKNASPCLLSVLDLSGVEQWGPLLWGWTLCRSSLVGWDWPER